jgi:hypothetical protein
MQEVPNFYSLSKYIALSMEIFSLEIYAATGSKQNQIISTNNSSCDPIS